MSINRERLAARRGRRAREAAPSTFTGNRALMLEEPLLFEIGDAETTGVDFDLPARPGQSGRATRRLGGLERNRDDRPCRPLRAGDGAPLHPAQPPELRDRPRPVPARHRAR